MFYSLNITESSLGLVRCFKIHYHHHYYYKWHHLFSTNNVLKKASWHNLKWIRNNPTVKGAWDLSSRQGWVREDKVTGRLSGKGIGVIHFHTQNAVSWKDKYFAKILLFLPMAWWSMESKDSWPEAYLRWTNLDKLPMLMAQNYFFPQSLLDLELSRIFLSLKLVSEFTCLGFPHSISTGFLCDIQRRDPLG